jgi:archaellum component FlaF (FlaF/FlaG flagellin family)
LINERGIPVDRAWGFIPPGEVGEMEIWLKYDRNSFNYKELVKGFTVKVSVDNAELVYNVPPLAPELEVENVIISETARGEKSCDGIIINLKNNWMLPIKPERIEIHANGEVVKYYFATGASYNINPAESRSLTVKFLERIKEGSILEVKLGITTIRIEV